MNNYKTQNAFTRTPSATQIISYILFLMQIIMFYLLVQRHLQPNWKRITLLTIYSICIGIHIIITLVVSISDPSDEFMINSKKDPQYAKFSDVKNLLYCQICKTFVYKTSRHCKICSRCVEKFDHHCIWINNCIGGKNYRYFILLLMSALSSMIIYISSICTLWVQNKYSEYILEMGFLWSSMVIVSIFLILIINLVIFHIYMNYLGLTTYQFIVSNRTNRKRISNSKNKIQNNQEQNGHNHNHNQTNTHNHRHNHSQNGSQVEQENTQENIQPQMRNRSIYQHINYTNKQVQPNQQPSKYPNSYPHNIIQNSPNHQHDVENQTENREKFSQHHLPYLINQKDNPNGDAQCMKPSKQKDNIFEEMSEDEQKHMSVRQSARFTQYFSQSKSLRFLMNSEAIKPQKIKKDHLFYSISQSNTKPMKASPLLLGSNIKNVK